MPELPEVETVVRQLERHLKRRTILSVETHIQRLRKVLDLEKLTADCASQRIERLYRRGKYFVVELSGKRALLMHLGMSGSCRVRPADEPAAKHEHVVFTLDDGESWRFSDPRRFGVVQSFRTLVEKWPPPELASLGPEPLEDDFHAAYLFQATRKRKPTIKPFLLDQRVVAGVGNIYASELLFRAGVRPGRAAGRVTRRDCERMVTATKEVLAEAIAAGGTTIDTYQNVDGEAGRFDRQLRVYGRTGEPCLACAAPIKQQVHTGRSTFYCPSCQS